MAVTVTAALTLPRELLSSLSLPAWLEFLFGAPFPGMPLLSLSADSSQNSAALSSL